VNELINLNFAINGLHIDGGMRVREESTERILMLAATAEILATGALCLLHVWRCRQQWGAPSLQLFLCRNLHA